MRGKTAAAAEALVILIAATHLSGCTVAGLMIGGIQDVGSPTDYSSHPADRIKDLTRGYEVRLVLEDGQRLKGKYKGLVPASDAAYAEHYAQARQQAPIPLPALGERITVATPDAELVGEWQGFDYDHLSLAIRGERNEIALAQVTGVTTRGGPVISGAEVREQIARRAVPLISEVSIATRDSALTVPLERVRALETPAPKRRWLKGALIGLAMDAVVVGVFAVVCVVTEDCHFGYP